VLCGLLTLLAFSLGGGNPTDRGSVLKEHIGHHESPQLQPKIPIHRWPHYRVRENDRSLSVFVVTDTGLARIGGLPLPVVPREWEVATRWFERDMDGDGLPEFLVAHGSRLWEFKWLDSAFALVATPTLPTASAWIEDLVFGDVNRDGLEEVILVVGEKRPESTYDIASALFVCRWSTDSLRVLWTDNGRFGLECASFLTPPDRLVGVYDVRNFGQPELLYQLTESSMEPCTYACYKWIDSALAESRTFRLDEDCIFAASVPDSERFAFVLGFSPFVENGITKLHASSVGEESFTGKRLVWN
jgi:hypothetical protein